VFDSSPTDRCSNCVEVVRDLLKLERIHFAAYTAPESKNVPRRHCHLQRTFLGEYVEGGAGVGGVLGAAVGGQLLQEFDGPVVAGDAEGAKERLAVFEAAGGGPGFEEYVYGIGLAGSAEGEGSFFGHLVGGGEELANEGEGVAAFDGE
jgi:hypothetical protein